MWVLSVYYRLFHSRQSPTSFHSAVGLSSSKTWVFPSTQVAVGLCRWRSLVDHWPASGQRRRPRRCGQPAVAIAVAARCPTVRRSCWRRRAACARRCWIPWITRAYCYARTASAPTSGGCLHRAWTRTANFSKLPASTLTCRSAVNDGRSPCDGPRCRNSGISSLESCVRQLLHGALSSADLDGLATVNLKVLLPIVLHILCLLRCLQFDQVCCLTFEAENVINFRLEQPLTVFRRNRFVSYP